MPQSATARGNPLATVLQRIPPFPMAMVSIMRGCANESAGLAEIAEAVSMEEVLAARIVQAANSAALAPVQPVDSVTAAVARLGSAAVRSIATAYFLNSAFSAGFTRACLDRESVWRHNLAVAAASAGVAGAAGQRSNAYFAGLMHDVGILVFATELGRAYGDCIAEAIRRKVELFRIEKALLGIDHAEIGAVAAQAWNFPSEVIEAIARHHQVLGSTPMSPIVSHVVVGNQVAKEMGFGISSSYGPLSPQDRSKAAPNVSAGLMSRARWALTNELPRIEALLGTCTM